VGYGAEAAEATDGRGPERELLTAASVTAVASDGQSSRRLKLQTGQMARPRSGNSSRKLVQPLVRQYSRVVIERRRMRRMEADRPTTDDW
jgi:hypothetical protein